MRVPPKITITGNLVIGKSLIGFGRDQLRILKKGMTFQGLKQDVRVVKPHEGIRVEAISRFSLDEIRIHVAQSVQIDSQEEQEEKRRDFEGMPVIVGGMTDESVGGGNLYDPMLDKCFAYWKPWPVVAQNPHEPFAKCSLREPRFTDDVPPKIIGGEHTTDGFASFHQVKYAKEKVSYIDTSVTPPVAVEKEVTFTLAVARSRINNCRITLTMTTQAGLSDPEIPKPGPESVYPAASSDDWMLGLTHEKFTVEAKGKVYKVLKTELRIDWIQNALAYHDTASFSANFNRDKTKLYVTYAKNPPSDCMYPGEPTYAPERKRYNGSGYTHYFGYEERCDAIFGYKSGSGLDTKLPSDPDLDLAGLVTLIFERVIDEQGDLSWKYVIGRVYNVPGYHLGYVYVDRDGLVHGLYQVLGDLSENHMTIDINTQQAASASRHTIGMTVARTDNPTKVEYDFCGIFSEIHVPLAAIAVENETLNYGWNFNGALCPGVFAVDFGCTEKPGNPTSGTRCVIEEPYLWSGMWCRGYPAERTAINNQDGYTIHAGSRMQDITSVALPEPLRLIDGLNWEYDNVWTCHQRADHLADYGLGHCIDPWTADRECTVDQHLAWNQCWAWGCGGTLTERYYAENEDFEVYINDSNVINTGPSGYINWGIFYLPYGETLAPIIAMPGNHWSQGHFFSGYTDLSIVLIYTIRIPFIVDNATGISSFVSADNNLTRYCPNGLMFQGILYSDESVESRPTRQEIRLNGEKITDHVYDITGHNESTLGYIGFLF